MKEERAGVANDKEERRKKKEERGKRKEERGRRKDLEFQRLKRFITDCET